ncbi:MAG: hypothetical protein JJ896_03430 [Rhodothermales bacterium]|nr:hypothetical protein [Rhodothermales bacterium]MBO6778686.1 hypothetical protein [Rhodothermales bacterium]
MRSEVGHAERGGHFFHFRKGDTDIELYDIQEDVIGRVANLKALLAFIRHVSGQAYSESMWRRCQEFNLRTD